MDHGFIPFISTLACTMAEILRMLVAVALPALPGPVARRLLLLEHVAALVVVPTELE